MRSFSTCSALLVRRPYRHRISPALPPSHSPKPPKKPFNKPLFVTLSVAVYAFTTYGIYIYLTLPPAPTDDSSSSPTTTSTDPQPAENEDVSHIYSTTAPNFDSTVHLSESLSGILTARKRLVSKARGRVLEVAAGTGRNAEYYRWKGMMGGMVGKVESVDFVDKSVEMLGVARGKWEGVVAEGEKRMRGKKGGEEVRRRMVGGVRFVVGDVLDERLGGCRMERTNARKDNSDGGGSEVRGKDADGRVATGDASEANEGAFETALNPPYDTIVATFSLCSTPHPTLFLQNLAKLCNTPSTPSPSPSSPSSPSPSLPSPSSPSPSSPSPSSPSPSSPSPSSPSPSSPSPSSPSPSSSAPFPPLTQVIPTSPKTPASPVPNSTKPSLHPRILLLEHGRSHYSWLNTLLDRTAPAHAQKHGCWWNRDIGEIVQESGLVVVKMERKQFGTLWIIEARPAEDVAIEKLTGAGEVKGKDSDARPQKPASSWFRGWGG